MCNSAHSHKACVKRSFHRIRARFDFVSGPFWTRGHIPSMFEIAIAVVVGFALGWRSRMDFPPTSPSGKAASRPRMRV
jgi:hypothetical protein